MKIIYRDDDAPIHGLTHFIPVHETLKKHGIVHTCAVICRNLDRHHDFIDYVKSDPDSFDLQFHCLDHIDYSDDRNRDILNEQFFEGLKMFNKCFGYYPTVWYPCWNRTSEYSTAMAETFGLTTNPVKYSFGQVRRKAKAIKEQGGVINFHHWAKEERDQLEEIINLLK